MKRISYFATAMIMVCCGAAQAEPVLVGAFDFESNAELSAERRIGFVLQLQDVDNNFLLLGPPLGGLGEDINLGPTMFWEDGESGILEFTSATDPHFDEITDLITDGIDDSLIVFWRWTIGSGFGGNGALESEMFGLDTDLFGNHIELIRITVNEVSIEPFGPDTNSVRTNVRYDFFGTPVPDPSVAVLLISGVIFKFTERRIR